MRLSPITLDKYYKYTQYTRIVTKINFAEYKKFPCLMGRKASFPGSQEEGEWY